MVILLQGLLQMVVKRRVDYFSGQVMGLKRVVAELEHERRDLAEHAGTLQTDLESEKDRGFKATVALHLSRVVASTSARGRNEALLKLSAAERRGRRFVSTIYMAPFHFPFSIFHFPFSIYFSTYFSISSSFHSDDFKGDFA